MDMRILSGAAMEDNRIMPEEAEGTFIPKRYWERRLTEHPDITGVGYLGRSQIFAAYQYAARKLQLENALRQYGLLDLSGRSVLDVGSGTGIWLHYWHQHHGERVVGLDFAQPSIERLKTLFPDDLIVQADLTVTPLPLPADLRFDLISAMDVLLHIVDPEGFARAIANLAALATPGGWLLISDPIVEGTGYVPVHHSTYDRVRTIATYQTALEANGFKIESIRPATVLLFGPLYATHHAPFPPL